MNYLYYKSWLTILMIALFGMPDQYASFAQSSPKREFRGVWLTTLSGLDWPPPSEQGQPSLQKASLIKILDNVRNMKLNAVIFQVRSRGNAFYASSIEPWASELSGSFGKDPGWDPLQFAVEECRKRALEIHAWINVFKVWSGGAPPKRSNPLHVLHARPDWVKPYGTDYWIDPGIPEARAFLADVIVDIAKRYDLDAVHLDYIRYPDADYDDAVTYRKYGIGKTKAEWRRENVNSLVADVHAKIKAIKPKMQIGSAPIGIYENLPTAKGWQALHSISQDSRRWLREEYHDYVAPQIYWGLRSRGSKIDFEALVRDWKQSSSGRQVYVGIAPYKPEVLSWLHEHIDASRNQGADGEVFFRYEHISDGNSLRGRYANYAIPPAMPWRDNIRPNPPRNLTITNNTASNTITWQPPIPAVDGDNASAYVLYRSQSDYIDMEDPFNIIAVLPSWATSYYDSTGNAQSKYAVTVLDRLRNESDAAASLPLIASGKAPAPSFALPVPQVSDPVPTENGLILIAYTVAVPSNIRLRLMNENGGEASILIDEIKDPGMYVIGIERDKMPEGIRRYVFESGSHRVVKPFTL